MSPLKTYCFIVLFVISQCTVILACDYNVRDAGFVDLGSASYHLFGLVNHETDAQIISQFSKIARESLNEANVEFELVNIDEQKSHPANKVVDSLQIKTFPVAVFISPDGQKRVVALPNRPFSFKKKLQAVLYDFLNSPIRKAIQEKTVNAYAVVLFIEGKNKSENALAKDAIIQANKKIALQMKLMPKAIAHPPVMITLTRDMLAKEDVLLWCLGLHKEKLVKPHVALIYGRARWVGPMFEGEKITAENLLSILYVIGLDCECDLDLSWVGGTMLPMQWDQKLEARIAKTLGFDPENPYVKMEVSRIIRRSRRTVANGSGDVPPASGLVGSVNIAQKFVSNDSVISSSGGSKMFWPFLASVAFLLVLVLIGFFIYLKGQKTQ